MFFKRKKKPEHFDAYWCVHIYSVSVFSFLLKFYWDKKADQLNQNKTKNSLPFFLSQFLSSKHPFPLFLTISNKSLSKFLWLRASIHRSKTISIRIPGRILTVGKVSQTLKSTQVWNEDYSLCFHMWTLNLRELNSLDFCLQIQFSFHQLGAVTLCNSHIFQEWRKERKWGHRACPTSVLGKVGPTHGFPHLPAHERIPRNESVLSRQVWITASWSKALSEPVPDRAATQSISLVTWATQMRPLFIIQPRLHSASDAFIAFISLESCESLKRLITRTVGVPENCDEHQFNHQRHLVGRKASNKMCFICGQVTHRRTSPFLPVSPPSPTFPSSSKLERKKERTG